MENPHLNPAEDRIDLGVKALKSETMPTPPSSLAAKMVAGIAPARQRSFTWIWKAAAAGGAIALIGFLAIPQSSSAAVSLQQLVAASERSDVFVKLTPFWVEGAKRTPKIWHSYMKGSRWRMVQSNFEQASDGIRVTSYFPQEGKAQTWIKAPGETNFESILGNADLRWWKSFRGEGLTLEHNVLWNGRRVDRYRVTTTSKAWGPVTSTLYADPASERPLYDESIHVDGTGSARQWEYLDSKDEALLEIRLKPGTKVEDITAQRKAERSKTSGTSSQPAKARIG